MLSTYQYPKYNYQPSSEQTTGEIKRHPVVVVGAGPVGLAAAIDLAQSGVPVVLLDDDDTVSFGSRGVCYAKRTLEVLDRLGVGDDCVNQGVSWNVGRTFFREQEAYNFNLLPEPDYKRPGMINLQQYYLEEYEIKRAKALPNLDLRFRSKVVSVAHDGQGATLQVETPDGIYTVQTDWLIVADGARSSIRRMMNLEIEGKIFMDRFLIADVVMKADFPAERWFWFDPPFHRGQSVLLKLVIDGKAPDSLLDSYCQERGFAADENIANSTRSTDFITPKSKTSLTFRNAVLALAHDHAFARALVNSGRLSVAACLTESTLNTPETAVFRGNMVPGAAMDDAPVQENGQDGWLLDKVGHQFTALVYVNDPADIDAATARQYQALATGPIPIEVRLVSPQAGTAPEGLRVLQDKAGRFAQRYDATPGTTYLLRPDQHVAARWRAFDAVQVQAALARATFNAT